MKLFYEHYYKLAHIGKGANAHVYKVRHASLDYVRAIKVLNDYIENEEEKVYQSFLKECKTLLKIGNGCHPNIVRIYGPKLIDNKAIVEMDCVQGETLDSYIKRKKFLDLQEVMTFIDDVVGALAYTHHDIYKFMMDPEEDNLEPDPLDGRKFLISPEKEKSLVKKYGVSHNDLHSNNVMRRDYDGHFILLDFGLAVQDGKCIKSSRVADGNPEYVAPEKFDSDRVNPRSDVYSLGVLMYEVLAGRVPFELMYDSSGKASVQSVNTVLQQHRNATPPPILPFRKKAFEQFTPGVEYERDYPEWLDEVISKCLSKDPGDRYSDARELLNDIRTRQAEWEKEPVRIQSGPEPEPITESDSDSESETDFTSYNEEAKISSRKWIIALAVAVCCLVGVAIWGYCMKLNFESRDMQLESFRQEAVSNGLYNPESSTWANLAEGVITRTDTIYQTRHDTVKVTVKEPASGNPTAEVTKLRNEIEGLNRQINALKNQKTSATQEVKTKVEYKSSPEDQKKIKQLQDKNEQLQKDLDNLKKKIQN